VEIPRQRERGDGNSFLEKDYYPRVELLKNGGKNSWLWYLVMLIRQDLISDY
jgi:hypothetical protein